MTHRLLPSGVETLSSIQDNYLDRLPSEADIKSKLHQQEIESSRSFTHDASSDAKLFDDLFDGNNNNNEAQV